MTAEIATFKFPHWANKKKRKTFVYAITRSHRNYFPRASRMQKKSAIMNVHWLCQTVEVISGLVVEFRRFDPQGLAQKIVIWG